jgi:F0F1-type ATP synthase assembly protein I
MSNAPDGRDLGHYMALAQVGMEMAAPVAIGAVLDHFLGSSPWLTVTGAALGFFGGIGHLVTLSNRKAPSAQTRKTEERK